MKSCVRTAEPARSGSVGQGCKGVPAGRDYRNPRENNRA